MRILVTGHLGYIGTVLVPMLKSNKNYSVYGLDSNLYERCTFGSEIPDIPWIRRTYVMWS